MPSSAAKAVTSRQCWYRTLSRISVIAVPGWQRRILRRCAQTVITLTFYVNRMLMRHLS